MIPTCDSHHKLAWVVGKWRPKTWTLTVVVKGSYRIAPGAAMIPCEEQDPITGDLFVDDDETKPLRYASDLAPFKPKTDILVAGDAKDLSLRVGTWSKRAPSGPLSLAAPERIRKAGTYGKKWLEERFPAFPEDVDWTILNSAPDDQQIPAYLRGDEEFAANQETARLPGERVRLFHGKKSGTGLDVSEIAMNLDTLVYDPTRGNVILVWRGVRDVPSEELPPQDRLYLAVETVADEPRQASDHARDLNARLAEELKAEDDESRVRKAAHARRRDPEPTDEEKSTALLPPAGPDLRGRDLKGTIMKDADLRRANLAGSNLEGAVLEGADLTGADLSRANLARADFTGARMLRADLEGANVEEADFSEATLCSANLARVRGNKTSFHRADLSRASLRGADLPKALLAQCRLHETDLSEARLPEADLEGACGAKVNAEGATLTSLRAAGAEFPHGRFQNVSAVGAVFQRGNLSHASFQGADLAGAEFEAADLSHATLSEANLQGARLPKANLREASAVRANLYHGNLARADASKADLSEANLFETDFMGTVLEGTLLRGANLKRTVLNR